MRSLAEASMMGSFNSCGIERNGPLKRSVKVRAALASPPSRSVECLYGRAFLTPASTRLIPLKNPRKHTNPGSVSVGFITDVGNTIDSLCLIFPSPRGKWRQLGTWPRWF